MKYISLLVAKCSPSIHLFDSFSNVAKKSLVFIIIYLGNSHADNPLQLSSHKYRLFVRLGPHEVLKQAFTSLTYVAKIL